jgi:hypothetical protein
MAPKKKPADGSADPKTGKKNKKQNARSTLLLVAVLGGGLAVLTLCCAGVGVGAYLFFWSGPSATGKWVQDDKVGGQTIRREWDFYRNGTGRLKITTEQKGKVSEIVRYFDYQLSGGDPLMMDITLTRADGHVTEAVKREIGKKERFKAEFASDTLTLTWQNEPPAILKRVR